MEGEPKQSYCNFGSINVETGEIKNGFINKQGEMVYKKEPWYIRIFRRRPEEIETLTITQLYRQLIWSNKKQHFDVVVKRKFNPYTNKTYRIFSNFDERVVDYDVGAYEKFGELILK